jgi:hypothetical protein
MHFVPHRLGLNADLDVRRWIGRRLGKDDDRPAGGHYLGTHAGTGSLTRGGTPRYKLCRKTSKKLLPVHCRDFKDRNTE